MDPDSSTAEAFFAGWHAETSHSSTIDRGTFLKTQVIGWYIKKYNAEYIARREIIGGNKKAKRKRQVEDMKEAMTEYAEARSVYTSWASLMNESGCFRVGDEMVRAGIICLRGTRDFRLLIFLIGKGEEVETYRMRGDMGTHLQLTYRHVSIRTWKNGTDYGEVDHIIQRHWGSCREKLDEKKRGYAYTVEIQTDEYSEMEENMGTRIRLRYRQVNIRTWKNGIDYGEVEHYVSQP
jgi:hypothetical protein